MRQQGFTLIELLCVLIILGCLGAMAIPQMVDLSDEAAHASVQRHAHSFAVAVQLVRAKHVINQRTGRVDNLAGYGGGNIDTNANGYPTDTANGNAIPNTLTGANRCRNVFNGILAGPAPICGGMVICDESHDWRAFTVAPQVCRFDYIEDTTPLRFFTYNASTGIVLTTNP